MLEHYNRVVSYDETHLIHVGNIFENEREVTNGLQVVKLGNDAVAEALLEAGANPNLHDPACGLTVTHDAAREGFIDTLRVLVKHGADVNLVDKQGNLPLHLAAKEGHLEVVKLLVGLTTDPKKSNTHNNTAGQLAHDYKRTDTAAFIDQYLSSG